MSLSLAWVISSSEESIAVKRGLAPLANEYLFREETFNSKSSSVSLEMVMSAWLAFVSVTAVVGVVNRFGEEEFADCGRKELDNFDFRTRAGRLGCGAGIEWPLLSYWKFIWQQVRGLDKSATFSYNGVAN